MVLELTKTQAKTLKTYLEIYLKENDPKLFPNVRIAELDKDWLTIGEIDKKLKGEE